MGKKSHKMVLLNGPCGVGKKTAAKFLQRDLGARRYKMIQPVRDAVMSLFNIDLVRWTNTINHYNTEPDEELYYDRPVDAVESLREDWVRTRYDTHLLGRLAVRHLREPTFARITVIDDVNDRDEVLPIIQTYGPTNCLLIRLYRNDCSFENEFGSYIELVDQGVTELDITNYTDIELYQIMVMRAVEKWLS